MSIDGPGILESDLAHDVYNEILDLYDAGASVGEIRSRLRQRESELFDDVELEIYLAASARALWEIGFLDGQRVSRLRELAGSGPQLELWRSGSDDAFVKARSTALRRLIRQISVPRKVARGRKKYPTIARKLFAIGDCVELAAKDGSHKGVVCKIIERRGRCKYAILVMSRRTALTSAGFERGKYYGRQIPHVAEDSISYSFGPHVILPEHAMLVRAGNPFRVVGRVNLDPSKFTLGSFGGVLEMRHIIGDFVRTETRSKGFSLQLRPLRELLGESEKLS